MLTNPEGQSRSKTLKAPLTCAGVYEVLTLRDITVTNSAEYRSRGYRRSTEGSRRRSTEGTGGGDGYSRMWDPCDGRVARTVKVNLPVAIRIDLVHHLVELLLRAARPAARQSTSGGAAGK